ncbi:hypothetical protein [Sandarakinorhabdus limnophila]|uniref:hypothetical protein n=1 Tax=Sandarakinorhabdus limnophila TaxID=210512 RepID=UPI0026EA39E3|nr:hypothetical protein [Sandarakinorhabdus limnophila]MCM0031889.1 hypothetical protein [Sandarakinorhabdus limnophila]
MANDVVVAVFDKAAAMQSFARRMLSQGFDVTVTGATDSVVVSQEIKGVTSTLALDAEQAKFVVLAYNRT